MFKIIKITDKDLSLLPMLLISTFGLLLQVGIEIKLQVDNKHKLFVEGSEVSSGDKWNEVYTANVASATQLAIFAKDTVSKQRF